MRAGLIAVLLVAGACASSAPTTLVHHPLWQQVDLFGMHAGTRAAAYDRNRNCLWVVSDVPPEVAGAQEVVTLTRVNVGDHTVEQTHLQLPATGFFWASILIDPGGKLWMAWGQSIYAYDPTTDSVRNYRLPPFDSLGVQVHLYDDGNDGKFVAAAMDPGGEIWVAAYNVAAVFGFNPVLGKWDRTVHLIWFNPYSFTRMGAPEANILIMNGYRSPVANAYEHVFARVDTSTGNVTGIPEAVREFALIDQRKAIFVDDSQTVGTVDLSSGKVTILATNAPVDLNGARFAIASDGEVWFAMQSYRNLGIGELDVVTGAIAQHPFPYIFAPGSPIPNDCPTNTFHCVPSGTIAGAGIEAVELDSNQNVWVVTDFPGTHDPKAGDPHESAPMAPIVELKPVKAA